jgi:predicted PurR-regulated permease PerM
VLGLLGGSGTMIYSLSDETAELVESLPTAAQKLRETLRSRQRKPESAESSIERMQEAATHLERAAEETTAAPVPAARGVQRVQIERPRFNINDYLWTGTLGLFGLMGQITVVSVLSFFMLASADTYRRKLVKIAGPSFARKATTIQALDEITDQIQRYLLVQLITSTLVGCATWLVFLWIGVNQAAAWGVLAAVLNFIPYIGAIVLTAGAMLIGFLQFGTFEMTALIGGASLVIQMLEGYLLTPVLTSRASGLSAVAIFAGVLGWGWLWGIWGLLLGAPILMIVKVACDRVDGLKPVGELLGE